MGERKVLNKYFPPDFDPAKMPKGKFDPFKQIEVRMMLPFSIQCIKCGEFMYRGKKFNSRKEDVHGEEYKGIKKYRFYIKCVTCNSEITFKTDPEHEDYEMESGATRNFEVYREQEKANKQALEKRAEDEKNDTMKALEHRAIDAKIEMNLLDAIEELKSLKHKREKINAQDLLELHQREGEGEQEDPREKLDIDEDQIKQIFDQKRHKRLLDDEEEEIGGGGNDPLNGNKKDATSMGLSASASLVTAGLQKAIQEKTASKGSLVNIKIKKRKVVPVEKKPASQTITAPKPAPAAPASSSNGEKASGDNGSAGLMGLLGAYGSSSDDSS